MPSEELQGQPVEDGLQQLRHLSQDPFMVWRSALTYLPRAQVSDKAAAMERWCKSGAWVLCDKCHSLELRHLREGHLTRAPPTSTKRCKNCAKDDAHQICVPSPQEVPEPLRDLNSDILQALRPLDIDCGPVWVADYGYRFHSAMIRLSWAAEDVQEKIRGLQATVNQKKAVAAYKFLMGAEDCHYATFVKKHRAFWMEFPDPTAERRKRPLLSLATFVLA